MKTCIVKRTLLLSSGALPIGALLFAESSDTVFRLFVSGMILALVGIFYK